MAEPRAISLPFKEAADFLRQKIAIGTDAWRDAQRQAHDHAFVVAGATKRAIVEDFQAAVLKIEETGATLAEFRKDFDRIVAAHGWSYKGGRGWRSRTILETNLRTAHAAGRWSQIQEVKKTRPYLRYVAVMDGRTRPEHQAWHDTVLPADDPWWKTHYPPNSWGCRCVAQSLSAEEVKRLGLEVSEEAPAAPIDPKTGAPEGIDEGFDYLPGESWERTYAPELGDPRSPDMGEGVGHPAGKGKTPAPQPPLPAPRPLPAETILPDGMPARDYEDAFLREFGAKPGKPVLFEDAVGEPVVVGDALFRNRFGGSKTTKLGREKSLGLVARALKEPDEIWLTVERHGAKVQLRRRYLARFDVEGRKQNGLAVFETTGREWTGTTAFDPKSDDNFERQRQGKLLYRRKE